MPAITSPPVISVPFARDGTKNAIPVPSQIPITPGAASYTTGFPPLNMTPVPEGGIPPSGADMNGILFAVSSYCAWLQAGGAFFWDAAVVANGGYPLHAIIRSADDPTQFFYNVLADNVNDPDDDPTGWIPFSPIVGSGTGAQSETLAAGQTDDLALDPAVGFLDLDADVAGSEVSGFANGQNGQLLVVTNTSANVLTLLSLTGSSAANQLRLVADLTLPQNMGQSFRYSSAIGKWIPV